MRSRSRLSVFQWRFARVLGAGAALLALAACAGSEADDEARKGKPAKPGSDAGADATPIEATQELPWEVRSEQGESLLPDVFYAEDAQNEQVMPTALGERNLISRLIYPTLGNPSLFVRDDDKDSVSVVLRIEKERLAALGARWTTPIAGTDRFLLEWESGAAGALSLYLGTRAARPNTESLTASAANKPGVSQVTPARFEVNVVPADAPASFQNRLTIRAVLHKEELAHIPAGLYDLRYELSKDGAVQVLAPEATYAELAYNSVRVFDTIDPDKFEVLNVTDTQIATHQWYSGKTTDKLASFVSYMNSSSGAEARRSAFVLFNGDLHDGGSPFTLRQKNVAWVYNDEAKRIVALLKDLPLPIVLTPGNHDGCASTGTVPAEAARLDAAAGVTMRKIVEEAYPRAWPSFDWNGFANYLNLNPRGGKALDLYSGSFIRKPGAATFAQGWEEIPRTQRNYILYDGFHQWQRSYGPLYFSFRFGKSSFVSLNSYEIRQHMRTGWGMYTVNYGGGLSEVQLEWLRGEIERGKGTDIVLSAHHDPRGGHMNMDRGYYYPLLAYNNVQQSLFNYTNSEVINPLACKLPNWALSGLKQTSCLHDGLQEWMAPDLDYDCKLEERSLSTGKCDAKIVQRSRSSTYRFSAMQLMDMIANASDVRTMVLGHTHANSLEVLAPGETLAPSTLSKDQLERMATLELSNPTRGYAWMGAQGSSASDYNPDAISKKILDERIAYYEQLFEAAGRIYRHTLGEHELVILRTTSLADLTSQEYKNEAMMGFTVLRFAPQTGSTGRMAGVRFFQYRGDGIFSLVSDEVPVLRRSSMALGGANNPLTTLFK